MVTEARLGLGSSWPFQVLVYNPLTVTTGYRDTEISELTRNFDLVLLPGTQRRQNVQLVRYTTYRFKAHEEISFGWSRGGHTNKSAGASILYGRRLRQGHLARIFDDVVPASIAGRIAAARFVSGTHDILAAVLYFAPWDGRNKSWAAYVQIGDHIIDTLDKIIGSVGVRCMPLIGVDMNDGFGMQDQGNGIWQDTSDEHVGSCQRNRERYAGQRMHEFMRKHHLATYNTFWDAGDTFFHVAGSSSRVDYLFLDRPL